MALVLMLARSVGNPNDVGAVQTALGAAPVQYLPVDVQDIVVDCRHMFTSAVQVTTLFPEHELPALEQLEAGHVQSAVGKLPPHGLAAGHTVVDAMKHMPAGWVQLTTSPFEQDFPTPPAQPGGTAGHMQPAVGKLPVHCMPLGQVVVEMTVKHPLTGSLSHRMSAPAMLQSKPAPAWQLAGGAGQVHAAEGGLPVHCLPLVHAVVPRLTKQPFVSRAQVTKPPVP